MAWLQGSSTWATIDTDLTKLICGTVNDGVGANAGTDAWQFDQGSGANTIRPPSVTDLTLGPMANRAGYWNLMSSGGVSNQESAMPGLTPFLTVCQQVNPIANTAAASHGRILIYIMVNTVNTVSGNYSTAQISYSAFDADGPPATGNWYIVSGQNVNLNAAGVATLYNGITVQITDPSGFLPGTGSTGPMWIRGFTGTYTYGIDDWAFYANRTGTPTFSTAPPGTAGTDYDIIDQVCGWHGIGYNASGQYVVPNGAYFSGLGIKTAAGCTGARYVISSITVASQKLALVKSVNYGNGVLDLIMGPAPVDSVFPSGLGGNIRPSHGFTIPAWIQFATTSNMVTNAMPIQYWMCVKPTGITLILNADPGYSGRMGNAGVCMLDSVVDTTYDIQPWITCNSSVDCTGGISPQQNDNFFASRSYWGMRRCQDGSWGSRDWQTAWMRTDMAATPYGLGGYHYLWNGCGLRAAGLQLYYSGSANYSGWFYASNSYKPGSWGSWDMIGMLLQEIGQNTAGGVCTLGRSGYAGQYWPGVFQGGSSGYATYPEQSQLVRGALGSHFAIMPGGAWGNGDEITDSVNGNKWFLCIPDYSSLPGLVLIGTNTYAGGVAVRENL